MSDLGTTGGDDRGAGLPPVMSYVRPLNTAPIVVTSAGLDALRATKPWVRFISIMIYVAAGFLMLGGLTMALASGLIPARSGAPSGTVGMLFGVSYLILAGFYIPPAVFLGRYASQIGQTLSLGNPDDLERALKAQKSFWRYAGIMIVIGIVLYVVGIIAAVGISILKR